VAQAAKTRRKRDVTAADYTNALAPDIPRPLTASELDVSVEDVLARTPFIDVHTHLFPPGFGTFARSGIDDLLTYHYLEAELFRASPIRPEQYWSQTPAQRADLVWQTLFVEQTPLSEATRGVVSVLHRLGLNPAAPSLAPLREFFRDQHAADHAQRVFRLAGISTVVMTNDPLDADEMAEWDRAREADDRFQTALRLDRILNDWEEHHPLLTARGYDVSVDPDQATLSSVRRFLVAWAQRFKPRYMAVSLPDTFDFPRHDLRTTLLSGAVLPACRDLGLPVPADEAASYVIGLGLRDALQIAAPTLDPVDYPKLAERYRFHYLIKGEQTELFDGVRGMLQSLREEGYLLAVATGKSRVGLNRALDQSRLTSLFDGTRCADETFSKPHPAMLHELTRELGQDVSRTVMIGDTTHDLQMAKNAGAAAVGVTYGAHPAKSLHALEPLFVAENVTSLGDWLRENA